MYSDRGGSSSSLYMRKSFEGLLEQYKDAAEQSLVKSPEQLKELEESKAIIEKYRLKYRK